MEILNINGMRVPHTVVKIIGDGACLFRALSFLLYGNQLLAREVRDQIVNHVVRNWEEFSIMSHDSDGNNYSSVDAYFADMSLPHTYGGYCELEAAGQLFDFIFEVYRNGELYAKFGAEGNPVERLRFTNNLSSGHFDAYILPQNENDSIKSSHSDPEFVSSPLQTPLPIPNNFQTENLNINGKRVPHTVVKIIGDGACLFRALSFILYGNQLLAREVREQIVDHVVRNWEEFSIMSHDSDGDNYSSIDAYIADMSLPHTYGGYCELEAAGQLFDFIFEVYRNGELYAKFGAEGNPVERLRFTNNLSSGHFDAYIISQNGKESGTSSDLNLPNLQTKTNVLPINVYRRSRCTDDKRSKQLKDASKKYRQCNPEARRTAVIKYQQKKPEVHRTAVIKYQQKKPEVHRTAVIKYQQKNPEVYRSARGRYDKNHPGRKNKERALPWKEKAYSGMTYNPEIAYEVDTSMTIGTMSYECQYCKALKWKGETAGMCCSAGKVQLLPFKPLPEPLYSLLMDLHPEHAHFMDRIRKYNGCFQMTSFGAKQVKEGGFMPTFKVQGQVCHLAGSLLPPPQQEAQFLQIYFVGQDEREVRLRCSNFPSVKQTLVKCLQNMLHEVNNYIKHLKIALEKAPPTCEEFEVVIHASRKPNNGHPGRFNAPTASEIALVLVGQQFQQRDIIIQSHNNKLRRVSEIHPSYDALQYPILFCRGEDGYSIDLPQIDPKTKLPLKKTISAASFYAYRIMVRQGEDNHLMYCRSLFSQYLVDMYAKIETERLNYIRNNQMQLRADNYIHLKDAVGRLDADAAQLGQMVVLPSSFTGGPRYMHERTQDALTYVRHYGRPNLFITFTCNPQWKDITDNLFPRQSSHDRHDIIARVFHLKVKKMMDLLTKGNLFGPIRCFMFSVEWQKRGLPHIHILLWPEKNITSDMIDQIICAEIPDPNQDPILYEIVKANMIHGPCGTLNPNSPCMKERNCSKRYPKPLLKDTITGDDGYPQYRRRSSDDGGSEVEIKNIRLDNRWVVPYNPVLLRTFNAHINIEYCNSVKSIKYICKYVNKGSDQAAFSLENEKDEVKLYESGRYISSSEAVWRILAFPIHERHPTVTHLAVHLENGQRVYFTSENMTEKVNNPPQTTLLAFFELCKTDEFAKTLLYCEVPSYYVWNNKKFTRRKRGLDVNGWPGVKKDHALGRVYTIHPNNTECYYLRLLLHEVRGSTCFSDLKNVNGSLHSTFQSACKALGLLEDDRHWNTTLEEAALCDSAFKLRELFTIMLVFCQLSDPLSLWEKYKNNLSEDIIRQMETNLLSNAEQMLEDIYDRCLVQIEDAVLALGGKVLSQYGLPQPKRREDFLQNIDYLREINYDTGALMQVVSNNANTLTDEQLSVYQDVLNNVESGSGRLFFLDAPGGTGKTFIINLLLAKIRSNRDIALAVASSGIAATLLDGGKTAHAAFKLPLNLNRVETPMCNVSKQSNIAQVLRECKLIVWDEITMAHKGGVEALNRTLKDIRSNDTIMGGVTVLLAGDFRQTLPVIQRGTRADEVRACIKSSHLWPNIKKISLSKNMRVHLEGDVSAGEFSKILLQIGNGDYPECNGKVPVSDRLATLVTTIEELISRIYPDISNMQTKSMDWFCERAILCPKNNNATAINDILMRSFEGQEMEYRSVDSVLHTDEAVNYPVEFLNSVNPPGLPSHRLLLKVGTPVMLLRNLNPPKLCNGTRLRVTALHKNVIEATVFTGCARGEAVFIPRIPIIPSDYVFEFKRLQFPLKVCFAMTINKAQGQSLNK